ncbi:MAG: helix-turn-helix transcriptional regulator [Blautia sp.]|nr:helix-turn-helix transcriptional regulator [Blautia sp.]
MGVLVLIFLVYAYCDFREECREIALREAQNTADSAAVWTEEYFVLTDRRNAGQAGTGEADIAQDMGGIMDGNQIISGWEQGLRALLGAGEGIVILDGQGQAVFSTDPELGDLCLRALNENTESPILSVGGGIFLAVAESASETRDWSCFAFHDVAVEKDIYRFPYGRFIFLVLLAGIGFAVAAYLLYRPIGRLVEIADGETTRKAPGEKELEFLSGSLSVLKDDSRKLQNLMRLRQDKLLEIFTLRLIRGDVSTQEEYEEYVKDLNLPPWQCLVTIVAVLNLKEEEETQSNIKEDVICLKIVEEMPQQLKDLAWMPPIYNACAIVAILGGDNEEELFKQIEVYYTELQKFSEETCGYPLLMGVSATHTDPWLNTAYRESVRALVRSGNAGAGGRKAASDTDLTDCYFYLTGAMASEKPYDTSYEKKVQQGIKNIDKAQCYQAANEFFGYLTGENYDQDEFVVYVLRFVDTILLTAMEIRVDMEALYPDGLRRLYDELLEVLEPSRERRYIKRNLIDPILEARSELMEKRSYSLLEDIEQLIREKKGDISLAECAESLGVHTTYIWKILKTERGKTFSDFLEEYKLEEAKRLLLNTNMTVADIAAALNYTNAQNFIRFFSKSTGMTPGKFRKLY